MLRTIQIKKDNPPSANLSRYRCMKAAQQYYSSTKQISYSEGGTFLPFSLWTWSLFQINGSIIKLFVCLTAMPWRHTKRGPHTLTLSIRWKAVASLSLFLWHTHTHTHTHMNQPTNQLHEAGSFSRSWQFPSKSRNLQYFKEPEGSLLCSHKPAICPCAQPHTSSQHPTILLFNLYFKPLSFHLGLANSVPSIIPCCNGPHYPHHRNLQLLYIQPLTKLTAGE